MIKKYSNERNVQILVSLLKSHGIRQVIASPGTTNMGFVASVQQDNFFKVYSSVDERSAAYMACGMAFESGEPVVLSCTGATASRNYMPALTEAYYRKLPILAVTNTPGDYALGHIKEQVIDRRIHPNDTVKLSVSIQNCKDQNDEWDVNFKINKALLELTNNGGGPVHINLATTYSSIFNVREIPLERVIRRYCAFDKLPMLQANRIAIFIGAHVNFSSKETEIIDDFCKSNNAVIFCDHTSGYHGSYGVYFSLVAAQSQYKSPLLSPDLLIHIGDVSGSQFMIGRLNPKEVWRVNVDGELHDTFKKLSNVFKMREEDFFSYYIREDVTVSYFEQCKEEVCRLFQELPDVPFSNFWIAQFLSNKMPEPCTIHFGILNSFRSWSFFKLSNSISTSCNVGGFGIDGILSTIIGASLTNPNQLHYVILGDLAFFYDMNSLGNRHLPSNLRILLINNGRGVEFTNYGHPAHLFEEDAFPYIAAAGHFGNQSHTLVKGYAESLGFIYISADSKNEFINKYPDFVSTSNMDAPILFEVFTDYKDESDAIEKIRNVWCNIKKPFIQSVKDGIKNVIPESIIDDIRNVKKSQTK